MLSPFTTSPMERKTNRKDRGEKTFSWNNMNFCAILAVFGWRLNHRGTGTQRLFLRASVPLWLYYPILLALSLLFLTLQESILFYPCSQQIEPSPFSHVSFSQKAKGLIEASGKAVCVQRLVRLGTYSVQSQGLTPFPSFNSLRE